jgi:hypothetical protein
VRYELIVCRTFKNFDTTGDCENMTATVCLQVNFTVDDKLTQGLTPAERREMCLAIAKEKIGRLDGDKLADAAQLVDCDQPVD